jgi:hypothetical protein
LQIQAVGLPKPEHEFRFHPTRRWRFDMAWAMGFFAIAVEIDGGSFVNGRHNRPVGFAKDLEKLNAATEMGWRVFRFTPAMVKSGYAVKLLQRVLG